MKYLSCMIWNVFVLGSAVTLIIMRNHWEWIFLPFFLIAWPREKGDE